MAIDWNKIFSAVLQVEETALPVFVHNPQSGNIAGVVLVAESILAPVIAEALAGTKTTVSVPDAEPQFDPQSTSTLSPFHSANVTAAPTGNVPSPVILGRKAVMVRGGAD